MRLTLWTVSLLAEGLTSSRSMPSSVAALSRLRLGLPLAPVLVGEAQDAPADMAWAHSGYTRQVM